MLLKWACLWNMFWKVTAEIADAVKEKIVFDKWIVFLTLELFFIFLSFPHPSVLLLIWEKKGKIFFKTRVWSYSATVEPSSLSSELELRGMWFKHLALCWSPFLWFPSEFEYWCNGKANLRISLFNNNKIHDAFRLSW